MMLEICAVCQNSRLDRVLSGMGYKGAILVQNVDRTELQLIFHPAVNQPMKGGGGGIWDALLFNIGDQFLQRAVNLDKDETSVFRERSGIAGGAFLGGSDDNPAFSNALPEEQSPQDQQDRNDNCYKTLPNAVIIVFRHGVAPGWMATQNSVNKIAYPVS
jgi:hypothetical protein